jgi:TPR repeat protein
LRADALPAPGSCRDIMANTGMLAEDRNAGSAMSDIDTEMNFGSGIAAFEAKHFSRAMQLLSPFADQGHAEAQYRLAIMYQNGLGVARNPDQAFKLMRAAAGQNHGLAQHGLGFMYLEGECAPKDPAEAARWFRAAAEEGLPGSQMTLGMLYEQGLGVAKDETEAKKWYDLARRGD